MRVIAPSTVPLKLTTYSCRLVVAVASWRRSRSVGNAARGFFGSPCTAAMTRRTMGQDAMSTAVLLSSRARRRPRPRRRISCLSRSRAFDDEDDDDDNDDDWGLISPCGKHSIIRSRRKAIGGNTMRPVASLAAIITLASLSCARLGEGPGRQSGWSQEAWERHRDALRQRPDIVRYYTFESVAPDAVGGASLPRVPSLAGEREALAYVPAGGASLPRVLQVVEGRWPGKKAVQLDAGCLEAKPFEVKDKAFTVELWFRKHGQGAERGNSGWTSGMLFAQGDGYWSGLRVWTSYPARNLVFEIGRPQPGHAFALAASDAVPDGVWHHLAATWDGREMRLYLNGLLLKAAEFAGDYTAPKAPFRVGFANAGIGSLKMDVDEVAVYNRALSPGEILRSAYFHA
ncbi:MAG: LamG domain-containing protein, partial [Planctomycetes bacterium]|nr:LamG domain-containing protein [Planctomycetota bacterium]